MCGWKRSLNQQPCTSVFPMQHPCIKLERQVYGDHRIYNSHSTGKRNNGLHVNGRNGMIPHSNEQLSFLTPAVLRMKLNSRIRKCCRSVCFAEPVQQRSYSVLLH